MGFEFDDSELATVLYALRLYQEAKRCGARRRNDHFYGAPALSNSQVDRLCERLNCSPAPNHRGA